VFWIKLGLIVIIVFIVISLVKLLLRKLLNVEKVKKEFFSYNHINELHRKIDRGLRTFSVISLILLSFVVLFYFEDLLYLILLAPIVLMVMDYIIKAYFEWKYTQYPKQSILTLTEMILILIAIIIVIELKLLGSY